MKHAEERAQHPSYPHDKHIEPHSASKCGGSVLHASADGHSMTPVQRRWATGDEAGDTEMVTGTPCAGNLVDSRLKELLPALPVVYVKAVPVQVRRVLNFGPSRTKVDFEVVWRRLRACLK